ncbi:MAG TPA: hypothetical protein VLH40_03780 [Atribacteraceae bacterium]|nr:hypothetical protein [Atribacteraceae bacterium]
MNKKDPPRINCYQCAHFYITWEKQRPHGCRALRFKSRVLPSLEVLRSSGRRCLSFVKKEMVDQQNPS